MENEATVQDLRGLFSSPMKETLIDLKLSIQQREDVNVNPNTNPVKCVDGIRMTNLRSMTLEWSGSRIGRFDLKSFPKLRTIVCNGDPVFISEAVN